MSTRKCYWRIKEVATDGASQWCIKIPQPRCRSWKVGWIRHVGREKVHLLYKKKDSSRVSVCDSELLVPLLHNFRRVASDSLFPTHSDDATKLLNASKSRPLLTYNEALRYSKKYHLVVFSETTVLPSIHIETNPVREYKTQTSTRHDNLDNLLHVIIITMVVVIFGLGRI